LREGEPAQLTDETDGARREAEREWTAERARMRREIELGRASARKALVELETVKRLRRAEREETRATRAALMEINRDAKGEEVNRVRELVRYENALRDERARREAAEAERNELMEFLRAVRGKLVEADATVRGVGKLLANDVGQAVEAIVEDRERSTERATFAIDAAHGLIDRVSQVFEEGCSRRREVLFELLTNTDT
jgi:hypothetical protein